MRGAALVAVRLLLEEVADRELEDALLFVRQRREGKAPFEAQRAERGEPADTEAPRGAHADQAVEPVPARFGDGVDRALGGAAVDLLEVPRVARVGEHDAADADLL